MTTRCEVHLLGKLSVTFADGSEPVTRFRTRKVMLLLAYLALHQGKSHSREFLMELLWPEIDPESSRHSLNNTISLLRRHLEPAGGKLLLESDHATVRLLSEGVSVDVHRFRILVSRGLSTRLTTPERRTALQEALALWEPPLPGIYDDWVLDEQAALQALADQAQEALEALPAASAEEEKLPPDVPLPTTFPVAFSSLLGREEPLEALRSLMAKARLVTLLGPGGVGKTRLALEAARGSTLVCEHRSSSRWQSYLPPRFSCPRYGGHSHAPLRPANPLADAIAGIQRLSGRVLIVLDNVEHLLPLPSDDEEEKSRFGIARTVRQLLESCTNLTVLATSRQPLGIEAEHQFPVSVLLPDTAVVLFVERARAVRPDFTRHAGNRAEIEAICTLLDGLPLAIELAASWVRVLSLAELRSRLEQECLWLESRRRDLNPRQKSLEATLRWSWQLLSRAEKTLLMALSVFRGGASLTAIEALQSDPKTLDTLYLLVDRSLVLVEQTPLGTRYRLLETIRQFAQSRLDKEGEPERVAERALSYFCALAEAAEPRLVGPEQKSYLGLLDSEDANFRALLALSLTQSAFVEHGQALAGALWRYWLIRGYLEEGVSWCQKLLSHKGGQAVTRARALTLHGAGALSNIQANYLAAERFNHECLKIRRILGDVQGEAGTLNSLGNTAFEQGYFDVARSYHEQSLKLKRLVGDQFGIAVSLNNLGNVAYFQKDFAAAQSYHEESLAIKQARGDRNGIAASLTNLASVVMLKGDLSRAEVLFQESLKIRTELGDKQGIATCVASLAAVALRRGNFLRSTMLFAGEAHLREAIGAKLPNSVQGGNQEQLAQLKDRLGEADFDCVWQEGYSLSPEDIIQAAQKPSSPAPPPEDSREEG